ncbi:hypothetical protein RvY_19065 [Ramazzottius varieornatus]|uniref:BED-type domain-containing protein n=1 Tax=Ramazzottius varieornatus TaxID=947166 RepID=A0A1D1W857_RAMVA|nr:hypothetical protein RvY_19065 [Ramazzottius varieornatus]
MATRKRSWNRQQSDEEDDGHHDALHDEVADFEAELLGPTAPLSTVESFPEELTAGDTVQLPTGTKKKGKATHSDMNDHFRKSVGKDRKTTAKFNYCKRGYKNVQGTSNLHYHMKKVHLSKLQKASKDKPLHPAFQAKQKDQPQFMSKKETTRHTNNLTDWIVCTAKPISTVDEPRFVKLISGLNASCKVPCRQTLRRLIVDGYKAKKVQTIEELSAIRACVVYLRRPTIRESFLASIQPATEDLKLPLDVATRWNSLLHMVESAYARRHEIHDYLSTQKGAIKNDVLSAKEWVEMEDLIELLKPLGAVDCSASKSSTFHMALAELEFLRSHLKAFNDDYAKAHWICELAKDMLAELEDCLRLSWKKPGVRI